MRCVTHTQTPIYYRRVQISHCARSCYRATHVLMGRLLHLEGAFWVMGIDLVAARTAEHRVLVVAVGPAFQPFARTYYL